jgi:hypothetical protein
LEQRKSLRDFVEANDKLLEAFGVFGGISAVLAHFGNQIIVQLVSITSFALAVLLLWETLDYPPKGERGNVSSSCWIFRAGLFLMTIELGGYVVTIFLTVALAHLKAASLFLIFPPLYLLAYLVADVTGLPKKLKAQSQSRIYQALLTFLLGVVLVFLFAVAQYLASLLRF